MDWTLFFSALISSTLLPGGSEALLIYRLHDGASPSAVVAIATIGNALGSLITFYMGRLGNAAMHRKWLRISERQAERAERWFNRYGRPSLIMAWLPIVGDPICLAAGLLRCPLISFIILVSIGKFGRYAFLAWAMTGHI